VPRVSNFAAGGLVVPPELICTVPSSRSGQRAYDVWLLPSGELTCPCKGFRYRGECRHADFAREVLEAREKDQS